MFNSPIIALLEKNPELNLAPSSSFVPITSNEYSGYILFSIISFATSIPHTIPAIPSKLPPYETES